MKTRNPICVTMQIFKWICIVVSIEFIGSLCSTYGSEAPELENHLKSYTFKAQNTGNSIWYLFHDINFYITEPIQYKRVISRELDILKNNYEPEARLNDKTGRSCFIIKTCLRIAALRKMKIIEDLSRQIAFNDSLPNEIRIDAVLSLAAISRKENDFQMLINSVNSQVAEIAFECVVRTISWDEADVLLKDMMKNTQDRDRYDRLQRVWQKANTLRWCKVKYEPDDNLITNIDQIIERSYILLGATIKAKRACPRVGEYADGYYFESLWTVTKKRRGEVIAAIRRVAVEKPEKRAKCLMILKDFEEELTPEETEIFRKEICPPEEWTPLYFLKFAPEIETYPATEFPVERKPRFRWWIPVSIFSAAASILGFLLLIRRSHKKASIKPNEL